MTKFINRLFLTICTLLAVFLSVSGFLTATTSSGQLFFQLLFLPVTAYFLYLFAKQIVTKQELQVISLKHSFTNLILVIGLGLLIIWRLLAIVL